MLCENLSYKVSLKCIFKQSVKYQITKLPFKEQKLIYKKDGSYFIKSVDVKKIINMFNKNGWSKEMYSFNTLLKRYDKQSIINMVKKRIICLIPCGHCKNCMISKQQRDIKRVNSQFKHSEYCYFLTFTLTQDKIRLVVPESSRTYYQELDSTNLSYLSTLSKLDDANITKNLKNKFRRHYGKENVKFHYYLCGEYGANTKRAHYHMLLMLNVPIPDLVREPTKKEIYRSKLISSKQFGMYMLEKCDKKENCARYICKYMTKESNKPNTAKLNRFQEKQQHYYLSSPNYDMNKSYLLVKKPEMLLLLYLDPKMFVEIYFPCIRNYRSSAYADTYQAEYTRKSRKLGITDNYEQDYINGVLNPYYMKKFQNFKSFVLNFYLDLFYYYVQGKTTYEHITPWLYLSLSYILLDKIIEIQRSANIEKYLFTPEKTHKSSNYQKENDIF